MDEQELPLPLVREIGADAQVVHDKVQRGSVGIGQTLRTAVPYLLREFLHALVGLKDAVLHAETEFEKYRIVQDRLFQSDFDRFLLNLQSEIE